ncbi:hypothetical protein ACEPAF_9822 [Sanghuangporus sanghuang]
MSVDTSSSEDLQRPESSTHVSPFEESGLVVPGSSHTEQNETPTSSSATHKHDLLLANFDVPREYWPSSTQALSGSSPTSSHPDEPYGPPNNPSSARNNASTAPNVDAMLWLRRQQGRPNDFGPRTDLSARNSLRDVILFSILSETLHPVERVEVLEDCKASAEASGLGIPFREILSEPMDHLGVSPLMYEIMRCHLDDSASGLEMVLFLIENWHENVLAHGGMGNCMNVVRTACLRRTGEHDDDDGKLFQFLRLIVLESQAKDKQQYLYYDVSVTPLCGRNEETREPRYSNPDFTAIIKIMHFGWRPTQPPPTLPDEKANSSLTWKFPTPTSVTYVPVEFLAARCAWRLKVDNNSLTLELLDGPGGSVPAGPNDPPAPIVDARVKVIMPEQDCTDPSSVSGSTSTDKEHSVELLLPCSRLRPSVASGPGPSEVKLSPCLCAAPGDYDAIRDLNDPRLHDSRGSLLFELTVRFDHGLSDFALIDVQKPAPADLPSTSPAGSSGSTGVAQSEIDEDDLYVTSEVDAYVRRDGAEGGHEESDWEELSQIDETEPKEGGWVKASWSGKDEDL